MIVRRTAQSGAGGYPVYEDETGIVRAEISERGEVRMLASGGHQLLGTRWWCADRGLSRSRDAGPGTLRHGHPAGDTGRGGPGSCAHDRTASAPLAGITVVSLEQAVAAPFATRQLADLGARVIKVERPGGGDFARRYDTTVHGSPAISSGSTAPRSP